MTKEEQFIRATSSHEILFDLQDLFGQIRTQYFLDECWPSTPYWSSESETLVEKLKNFTPLASAQNLLGVYAGDVSALKPDGTAVDVKGGEEAIRAYNEGYTCYLRSIEEYIPAVDTTRNVLAQTLGIPESFMTTELFCSQERSGVAMHSDYDINLAVLVRGTKHWKLAKNNAIENQPSIIIAGNEQPAADARTLTNDIVLPMEMPIDSQRITMNEGGVLFIPRGWWHETQAIGECLQLNFVVKGPQFMNMALAAVRSTLLSRKEWRKFALGSNDAEKLEQDITEIAGLVKDLREELSENGDREIAKKIMQTLAYPQSIKRFN